MCTLISGSPELVALLATTTHDVQAWRAAGSRADLAAQLPDAPLRPISLPPSPHPRGVIAVRFYSDEVGTSWLVSAAEPVAPPSAATFGPVQMRNHGDRVEVVLRQAEGQPMRSDRSLGYLGPGEGIWVGVNWRQPAKASGGPTTYVDTLIVIMWPTEEWEMRRPSDLGAHVRFRTVDLREVLY